MESFDKQCAGQRQKLIDQVLAENEEKDGTAAASPLKYKHNKN